MTVLIKILKRINTIFALCFKQRKNFLWFFWVNKFCVKYWRGWLISLSFLFSFLYKAAVLPYSTYCNLIWHFCRASDSRRLERIQERALKAIYCDKHSSYGQLLSMAGPSTLHNRRLQDIAILMYKVKNNMCPTYISTLFEQPAIKYELRNHDFTIPRFNTVSFGKHSPRYMGLRVWSSVPSNVKKAFTLSTFKYNIRKGLMARVRRPDWRH